MMPQDAAVTCVSDEIRQHVKRVVAEAPKLTPEQKARVCALLRGSKDGE